MIRSHRHTYRPSPVAGFWSCARCGAVTASSGTAAEPGAMALAAAALAIGLVATVAVYAWAGIVFGVLWEVAGPGR